MPSDNDMLGCCDSVWGLLTKSLVFAILGLTLYPRVVSAGVVHPIRYLIDTSSVPAQWRPNDRTEATILVERNFARSFQRLARSAPDADLRAGADSDSVLTVDVLTRMTTFWATFRRETDSLRGKDSTAMITRSLRFPLSYRGLQLPPVQGIVDMIAMAAKYPSVAHALQQAGLTAPGWEAYRLALWNAALIQQAIPLLHQQLHDEGLTAQQADSALWQEAQIPVGARKNVVFLSAHQQELDALKKQGMKIPTLQVETGAPAGHGSDLDP